VIAICTDSNAQLPPDLIDRYNIEVVPLTVTVDGNDYLEGVDLDADDFYDLFADGRQPSISTAAPSPGRFAAAYQHLADRGASAILSIHIGSEVSGTLNAARLGAAEGNVPVRIVDTHAASFVVGCTVWAAAEALGLGASLDEAAAVAGAVAGRIDNVFIVGTLAYARAGGRLAGQPVAEVAIPVLRLADGKIEAIGHAPTPEVAAGMMAEAVVAAGTDLRVGIGDSDPTSRPVADELVRRLEPSLHVTDIVRYRVGPSVGVHTGPGTAGAVYYAVS
jgi:DegV family protein with EDD domain